MSVWKYCIYFLQGILGALLISYADTKAIFIIGTFILVANIFFIIFQLIADKMLYHHCVISCKFADIMSQLLQENVKYVKRLHIITADGLDSINTISNKVVDITNSNKSANNPEIALKEVKSCMVKQVQYLQLDDIATQISDHLVHNLSVYSHFFSKYNQTCNPSRGFTLDVITAMKREIAVLELEIDEVQKLHREPPVMHDSMEEGGVSLF